VAFNLHNVCLNFEHSLEICLMSDEGTHHVQILGLEMGKNPPCRSDGLVWVLKVYEFSSVWVLLVFCVISSLVQLGFHLS